MSDSCFTPRKTLKLHCTDIKRILNCLRRNAIACGLLRHFAACGYSPCSMWNWEFFIFFWHKAACDFFFFCVQLLGPSIFLALLLLQVSPPPLPKLSAAPHRAVRSALINALGESPLFNIGHGRTYICWGGSKWLLANALIFVALAECTLHGAVLRGDLTSCVGRGGQEASREHMQADPGREAQPGCS